MSRSSIKTSYPSPIAIHSVCFATLLLLVAGCGSEKTASSVPSSDETASATRSDSVELESSPATTANPTTQETNENLADAAPDGSASSRPPTDPSERKRVISQADALRGEGRYGEAIDQLKSLLIVNPNDVEVIFRLATITAASGDLAGAVELLNEIPIEHPEAGLAAQGQAADWCEKLHRYQEAETRFRAILDRAPNAVPVLRHLAFLLNRQGRRQEASEYVRKLCLLGNVTQDELHSLIAISNAMHDPPETQSESIDSQNPSLANTDQRNQQTGKRYYPISPYGDARLAFQEGRYADVMKLLKPKMEDSEAPPAMIALFGRAAGESQDDAMIAWWLEHLTPEIETFADYWATMGMLELMGGRYESAVRSLGEALTIDPTDQSSISRMRQALGSLGADQAAERWFDRWTAVRASVDANNSVAANPMPDPESVEALASTLDQLHRPLEAILWRATVASTNPDVSTLAVLNEQRKAVLADNHAFPDPSLRLCGLKLNDYPLPDRGKLALSLEGDGAPDTEANQTEQIAAAFSNVAESIGLKHTFRVASQPQENRFAIYQTLGGGVAVVDYDLDGNPDLYFAQGAADPPEFRASEGNRLLRNLQPTLSEASAIAGVDDAQYCIGVTSGDWNQDGLPDLGVANIGSCILLINNGDGTFRNRTLTQEEKGHRVPASLGFGDVNGDHLPDLIQIAYVDDPSHTIQPPVDDQGNVTITVAPGSFDPAIDHLFENSEDGTPSIRQWTGKQDARFGLGLVVGGLDDTVGNEVFIGNDSLPNRIWKLDQQNQPIDLATLLGCAYGYSGGATGAMGIAVGDFDRNSKVDLYVANYENENANLYLSKGKSFEDRNRQYKLDEPSRVLVAFGAQSIDYDGDGDEDLVVTNGHLDDAKSIRGTYAQPMQLFCNLGTRFDLVDVIDPTGFWDRRHVGRALATLDYNRDGQTDFVVTQIERPSALLINQTQAHPRDTHWLQVQLVGTESERDAIGARVDVQIGDETLTRWAVAGDGYLCSNESVIRFGLGMHDGVDQIKIRWPSGRTQTIENVAVDQQVLVVEAEPTLFALR